jgi:hypothetical protein
VRAGDWVRVQAADRHRLAEALVDQLPPAGPGWGNPRIVRVSELVAAGRSRRSERPLDRDLTDIVSLVQRPVTGSGELYAGRRDEVGRYTRLEQPLHYADTDWGRYLNYTTGSGDDAEIHVGPASPAVLAATLRDSVPPSPVDPSGGLVGRTGRRGSTSWHSPLRRRGRRHRLAPRRCAEPR